MSGYTRGGVQMVGLRGPSTPATGTAAGTMTASTQPYAGYASTYASASNQHQVYTNYGYNNTATATAATAHVPRISSAMVVDDYERWYTEPTATNRMLLALRSGIHSEVSWALDRLCRLCMNEQFSLAAIPGLTDALFEWPEWFIDEFTPDLPIPSPPLPSTSELNEEANTSRKKGKTKSQLLDSVIFSPQPAYHRQRKHALESLFILRNAVFNEPNAAELAAHSNTRKFIVRALTTLNTDLDDTTDFLLNTIEILQSIAGSFILPRPRKDIAGARAKNEELLNPVPALEKLANESSNRSVIIASLTALTMLFSNPQNLLYTSASSPALSACIRYLPLYQDTPLIDACLDFFRAHLSHPPMTKAFLINPEMPSTLKLLVGLIISEQDEEIAMIDVSGQRHMAPAVKVKHIDYELTADEIQKLGSMSEPERCFEWMRTLFVADPNGELTQVDFWTAYKDIFTPFQEQTPLLVASDVIKNVSIAFTRAQAMVLDGPPQKFVIRGINKRKKHIPADRYACQWNRSECNTDPFRTPEELHTHIQETHLQDLPDESEIRNEGAEYTCSWATCAYSISSTTLLKRHVWTHITLKPSVSITANDGSNGNGSNGTLPLSLITFSSATEPYLISNPTMRPPPPPPSTTITFPTPTREPASGALTALLVVRTLFHAAFASSDAAPRADADHFGFPGIVDEVEELENSDIADIADMEQEGERRGRRAFASVRHLLESVRIKNDSLMDWIVEMIDASTINPYN